MVRKNARVYPDERQGYNQLLKFCLSVDSQQDEKKIISLGMNFSKLSQELLSQFNAFKDNIAKVPLSALVLLWGDHIRNDRVLGNRYLGMMQDLLETGSLLLSDKKKVITLQDFSLQDPSLVIENIRCCKDWSIHNREDFVLLYKTFSGWLSKETCGYIPEAVDLDRIATKKRQVSFECYIEILSHVDLREQILAKIFYLGGHRALEEVLSIKIEDIDFSRCCICFSEDVSYPRHLFDDIKAFIEGRKKGFIFLGRDGERLSHTTPFRALKTVTSELELDPAFTFKDFTKNI